MDSLKMLLPFLMLFSKGDIKKGVPGGVATLDENGKVPVSQMPQKCEIVNGELKINVFDGN